MKLFVVLFFFSVVVAGAWVLYTFPPGPGSFYPGCVFRSVTGYECPGCGTTRALHALLHGRVKEAFLLNPLIFAMGFVGLFAIPSLARREVPPFMTKTWFVWTAVTVIVGWTIARNVWM